MEKNIKCKIPLCNSKGDINKNGVEIFPKGFCHKHYVRLIKYGDPHYTQAIRGENRKKNPLYSNYRNMINRCHKKYCICYKDYGGRGIKICDRWLGDNGFNNFCIDMGQKPTEKHSVDRIDVNGDYEPSNCKWATHKEQANNKRINPVKTTLKNQ